MEVRLAEAEAALAGMKEARRKGYRRVIIESDCKTLIDELKAKSQGRSDFHLLLDDINELCNVFDSVVWSFVSRKHNRVAHELAHICSSQLGRRDWDATLPRFVMNLCHDDIYNMRYRYSYNIHMFLIGRPTEDETERSNQPPS
ncbi:uncharacterized protein LOC141588540 [Silene latifolia]|uniref:uncharacterized protein LOC141588540 n=1 Tax=Silene latifolia TaxID=37657 RepID=UPI003D778A8E